VQAAAQKVAEAKAKELAYIRQEIKNPLDGIMFTRSFIEHTDLTEDQKQLVETSATCEKQLRKILDDMDLNRWGSRLDADAAPVKFWTLTRILGFRADACVVVQKGP
jgi:signal transduction histidine kinase